MNLNGIIIDASLPVWCADHRLLKYNDGVFSSFLYQKGKIGCLPMVAKRLAESARLLRLAPFQTDLDWNGANALFWQNEIEKLTQNYEGDRFRVRIQLYRATEGLLTPNTNVAGFWIEAQSHTSALQIQGLTLGLAQNAVLNPHASPEYTRLKLPNALPYILANIERVENKWDEILILDTKGHVIEGGSSNVFFWADNTLFYVNHELLGGYSGMTQAIILEKIATALGFPTAAIPLHHSLLSSVEEVIVVNAVQGIRYVQQLQTPSSTTIYTHSVAQKLFDAYENWRTRDGDELI